MSVLRVYLSASAADEPPAWWLCDARGACLSQGTGGVLPAGIDSCQLVLAAGLCRVVPLALPRAARRKPALLIGFALEETLLNGIEDNRYVWRAAGEDLQVCLTARDRLQRALDWLGGQGVRVDRIVAEEQCLPVPPEAGWTLAAVAAGWAVRLADGRTLCVPGQGAVLWGALRGWSAPQQLWLCGDPVLPTALADLPVQHLPVCDWRQATPQAAHDFATARPLWRRLLQRAPCLLQQALLGLLMLTVLEACWLGGQWRWLQWQRHRLAAEMQQEAASMGLRPQGQMALLDQARQQLAQRRQQHGLVQPGDLLPMLAALPPELISERPLHALRYRQGALMLQGSEALPVLSAGQRAQLAQQGWRVEQSTPAVIWLRFAASPAPGSAG